MGQFSDAAHTAFRDFATNGVPASGPHEVDKGEVRAAFTIGDALLTAVINGLLIGSSVHYATRTALYADLAHDEGALGVVYNDSTAARNGVYVKSGASGAGAWTLTALALPSTFSADLGAVQAALGGKQPLHPALTSIAARVTTGGEILYTTGPNAYGTSPISAFARLFLEEPNAAEALSRLGASESGKALLAADYGAMRSLLSLVPGVDVQTQNGNLSALAALSGAAGKMIEFTGTNSLTLRNVGSAGRNVLAAAGFNDIRDMLSLVPGSHVQAWDAGLQSIANKTTAADQMLYTTAPDVYAVAPLTAAGRALVGAANVDAQRALLSVPSAAEMTAAISAAVAGLVNSAPGVLDTLNEVASALGNDPNFATTITNLIGGKQAGHVNLTALSAISGGGFVAPAIGRLPYFNGTGSMVSALLTEAGRLLLTAADAGAQRTLLGMTNHGQQLVTAADFAAMRALLGLVIGTNVQQQNVRLQSIADLITPANRFLYTTGTNTYDLGVITAAGRAILDDPSVSAMLDTLGFSANGKSLVAAGDYAAMRGLLSVLSSTETQNAISAAVAGLVDSSPATLNTLNELANALGDDPNFSTTVMNLIGGKQGLSPNLTAIAGAAAPGATGLSVLAAATPALGRAALGAAPLSTGFMENQAYDSLDPAKWPFRAAGNAVVQVDDPILAGKGFTFAIGTGVGSGTASVIGARNLPAVIPPHWRYFVRAWYYSPGTFGTPRAYAYTEGGTGRGTTNLTQESAPSANVRSYVGKGRVSDWFTGPKNDIQRIGLGSVNIDAAGYVVGVQFAFAPYDIEGIDPEDFSATPALSEAVANALADKPSRDEVAVPSMFLHGNYPDRAHVKAGAVTDITDPALTTRGITRGITRAANETSIYAGERLGFQLQGNEGYALRLHVQTADIAGSPRAYFEFQGQQLGKSIILSLEEQLSPTAAIYSAYGYCTPDMKGADWIGLGGAPGLGTDVRYGGMQFAVRGGSIPKLPPFDFPTAGAPNDPLLPGHLWLREGETLPFYPLQVLANRNEVHTVACGFSSLREDGNAYSIEGRRQLRIEADECGPVGAFDFYDEVRNPGVISRVPVVVHRAPATRTGSVAIHLETDSLGNRAFGSILRSILEGGGMDPTFYGTMQGWNQTGTEQDGEWGEWREGKEAAEMVYSDMGLAPVADTPEAWAAYVNGSHANRRDSNPMIRPAVGDEADARNGYVYDPTFYRTRAEIPDLDVVGLGFGRNDATEDLEASPALVEDAYKIMLSRWRADQPDALLMFWFATNARSPFGDRCWERADREIIRRLVKLERNLQAAGDSRVFFIPVYGHMSARVDWSLSGTPDPDTGVLRAAVSDVIHYGFSGLRHQPVRPIANCILEQV